jgi:uncharacterized protein
MEHILKGFFFNPTKGNLTVKQAVKEIITYIKENPELEHEVVVGCDSSSSLEPTFPLAIVVLKEKRGGRFFLRKIRYNQDRIFHTRRDRIIEEVMLSCRLALWLKSVLEEERIKEGQLPFEFKYIHADVGENGLTRDMIKEVVGLIQGNGFEAKIKPASFAASVVADRFS